MLATLIGLALITFIGVGIRLLVMVTIQQRRERMNRQINERLRTLIAAYKVLGGSFTGDLTVDPTHLRDLNRRDEPAGDGEAATEWAGRSDRARRIRDAVEAALSDIILLGTEAQVRLAERAARVVSLAAHQFNQGLRTYYFGLAMLAWFINPWIFMLVTAGVVGVLYQREFHSSVLHVMVYTPTPQGDAPRDADIPPSG